MDIALQLIASNGDSYRQTLPDPALHWYAFSRLGTADGQLSFGAQTKWTGFTAERPFRETRVASWVDPAKWRKLMQKLHELPITVVDDASLFTWMILGGEALVESSIAHNQFPKKLAPDECDRVAGQAGWTSTKGLPAHALNHAPSAKIRARVLLRDGRRCRLCRRSPDDDPHAFLEAHHGIPWGDRQSGLTVEENLFTVCSTCHRGISRGLERQFLHSVGVKDDAAAVDWRARYFEGVMHYRRLMAEALGQTSAK